MEVINLELNPIEQGVMLIWERIESAAQYKVNLFSRKNKEIIDKNVYLENESSTYRCDAYNYRLDFDKVGMNKIDEIYIQKEKTYLSIKDLAQLNINVKFCAGKYKKEYKKIYGGYFVQVIAEDRAGNEIASSELINFAPGKKEKDYVAVDGRNTVCIC